LSSAWPAPTKGLRDLRRLWGLILVYPSLSGGRPWAAERSPGGLPETFLLSTYLMMNGFDVSGAVEIQTDLVWRYSLMASIPLSPQAAALVSAEGRGEAYGAVGVDPYCAGLKVLREADGPAEVPCPDSGSQSVVDVIGCAPWRRLRPSNGMTARTGPKTSSCAIRMSLRTLRKDRWLDELPAGRAFWRCRPLLRGRTLPLRACDIDVVKHLLELRPGCYRPDVRVGQHRVTDFGLFGQRHNPLDELVMNGALDQQPRARDAGLSGCSEYP
jgi:hypothetical protein